MLDFFKNLFSSDSFMPHGHCYLWLPNILWLHVISDSLIAASYFSIPFALVYLLKKRTDLAYKKVFWMFGVFIMACGVTHAMNIWTIWDPLYRLDGVIKAVTAAASLATAIFLWPLIPKVLMLPSPSQLAESNKRLESEIIERKAAEAALKTTNKELLEAEKLKSRFVANVSHELRTPLTLILAPIESILSSRSKEATSLSEAQQRSLRTVHNNAVRLLQMVNSLLDFSKLEDKKVEVHREPLDIVEQTKGMIEDFKPSFQAKSLRYELSFRPDAIYAEMDRYLYERILFNLLSNAVKFTPPNGEISVDLNYIKEELILRVSDTGIGIAEENQKMLFQKFRQIDNATNRRYEGTGLGLTLVKEFSELLGGGVHVESATGRGSTFEVRMHAEVCTPDTVKASLPEYRSTNVSKFQIPVSGPEVLPLRKGGAQTKIFAGQEVRVLIAEDNVDLADYIASLLGEIAKVKTVHDGAEALKMVDLWKPDMILSDIMMPGMDGLTLCKTLKADSTKASIPIVLLTALTHRDALMQGWEAGADEYLFKPFHPTELLTRVRSILKSVENRKKNDERLVQITRMRVEQEAAENHIHELRRLNKIKDEFLATVSHELRTPMNAIIGWTQLIRDHQTTADEQREAVDIIYKSAENQMKLIDDLLDISRIITGKMKLNIKPVLLPELVEDSIESMTMAAQGRHVKIHFTVEEDIAPIAGDPDRLRQVVWNLLSNAIKFNHRGGNVYVRLFMLDSKVALEVRDEGEGIDPDFLPHVFERFIQEDSGATRRYGGLGLGLSIARNIVELHGGEIQVKSPGRGKGSTFLVVLSVAAVKESGVSKQADESSPSSGKHQVLQNLKVLVVDDDLYSRHLVRKILGDTGAVVIDASNAKDAIVNVKKENPDVILSDIGMPDVSGYDFIREVRTIETSLGHHIPSAALSAYVSQEDRNRSIAAGFDVHLSKPIEPNELISTVAKLAGREAQLN